MNNGSQKWVEDIQDHKQGVEQLRTTITTKTQRALTRTNLEYLKSILADKIRQIQFCNIKYNKNKN